MTVIGLPAFAHTIMVTFRDVMQVRRINNYGNIIKAFYKFLWVWWRLLICGVYEQYVNCSGKGFVRSGQCHGIMHFTGSLTSMFNDPTSSWCFIDREVEPSRQGSYFGHFSAITQPILNQLTQFLERDEIRIVSSRVQNFKSIGLELTEL